MEKCGFLMAEIEYLGREVSSKGVRSRREVEAVLKFPVPSDVHGVRQFVG